MIWHRYAQTIAEIEVRLTQGNGEPPPRARKTRTEGSKRPDILAAATARFGRDGYEDTKWADIAADVGVGPTALYHYFESKQHCLFVIMDDALVDALARFERITSAEPQFARALEHVLADAFDLTQLDVERLRVLVSEHTLLTRPRTRPRSPQEEEARLSARARTRDLELAWADFLRRAMEHDALPASDPRMLARAVLGLYNSIWHWYRPSGTIGLDVVAGFYSGRILEIIGVDPDAWADRIAA
jgi:TetR/AcrR family transcriptional regulator, cholesterol catabolism regulator